MGVYSQCTHRFVGLEGGDMQSPTIFEMDGVETNRPTGIARAPGIGRETNKAVCIPATW